MSLAPANVQSAQSLPQMQTQFLFSAMLRENEILRLRAIENSHRAIELERLTADNDRLRLYMQMLARTMGL